MTSTGRQCEAFAEGGRRCPDQGCHEYCGFCAAHWMYLKESQRNTLLKEQAVVNLPPPPLPDTIVRNHTQTYPVHNIHHPPQSRIVTFVVVLAATLAAFGLAKLLHLH